MEVLFQKVLGIDTPWYVESLKFDPEQPRLDVYINFQKGATFADNLEDDPSGKEYKAYDTISKVRRPMNFFQHECYLHAREPRIKQDDG